MKSGKTIQDLAAEIARQNDAKKDYIVDAPALRMTDNLEVSLPRNGHGDERYPATQHAHNQMAGYLDVPRPYWNRIREQHPALLATTFNTLMPQVQPTAKSERVAKRMVRTLDGNVRAFLSNKYRLIDNHDLGIFALQVIAEMGGDFKLESCDITERYLRIKVIHKGLTRPIRGLKVGDTVAAGFCLENSEIGMGHALLCPFHEVLSCLNGMKWNKWGEKRRHVGRAYESDSETMEIYADDTREADDRAFMLRVRDNMRAAVDPDKFETIIKKVEESLDVKIEQDPVKAVEVVQKRFNLTDGERTGVLQHLITGGSLTQWGMSQALTRYSQDVEDYDRATEFEEMGPQVIELPKRQWEMISTMDPKNIKQAHFAAVA